MKLNDNIYLLELESMGFSNQPIYPVVLTNENDMILVDTGYPGQIDKIKESFKDNNLDFNKLKSIILTHQDIDHVGCVMDIVKEIPNIKIYSYEVEKDYITGIKTPTKIESLEKVIDTLPEKTKFMYNTMKRFFDNNKINIDKTLKDKDIISEFDNVSVIYTPGHTPGHMCLYIKDINTLIAGDCLINNNNTLSTVNPSINYDNNLYIESLKKLSNYDIEKVICYHGGLCDTNVNEQIKSLVNLN